MNNYSNIIKRNPLLPSNYNFNTFDKINDMNKSAYIDTFFGYICSFITINDINQNLEFYSGEANEFNQVTDFTLFKTINIVEQVGVNPLDSLNGSASIIADLDKLEGVQSIPEFDFINLHEKSSGYAGNQYDIESAIKSNILYPSLDPSVFEIKYPNKDIKGRAVKP